MGTAPGYRDLEAAQSARGIVKATNMKTSFIGARRYFRLLSAWTIMAMLPTCAAWAQPKHHIAFATSPEHTRYTQQRSIEIGDIPGHHVRIFEIHRTYPERAPEFLGIGVKEVWRRGYSDYVGVNGSAHGYDVFVMENGDKIFSRWNGTSQAVGKSDEATRSRFVGVLALEGGTGKFRGIRGSLSETVVFDPKAGFNESEIEGDYWKEK